MEVKLDNHVLPQTATESQTIPTEGAARPKSAPCREGGVPVLTVVESAGVAVIPGEEPVDERALTRDDPLGQLVDQAFGAASQVTKNIGESADKLRELFERNREDAEVKEQRLESVLKAEAATSPGDDERLDAMLRDAELQV